MGCDYLHHLHVRRLLPTDVLPHRQVRTAEVRARRDWIGAKASTSGPGTLLTDNQKAFCRPVIVRRLSQCFFVAGPDSLGFSIPSRLQRQKATSDDGGRGPRRLALLYIQLFAFIKHVFYVA